MTQCTKITYTTRARANAKAKNATRSMGKKMHAYRCDVCGFFHLSSKANVPPLPTLVASKVADQ